MLEILIAAGAGVAVFLFLLFALALKNPSLKKPPQIHTCARCNCEKKRDQTSLPADDLPQHHAPKGHHFPDG